MYLIVFAEDSFLFGTVTSFVRVYWFWIVTRPCPQPETYTRQSIITWLKMYKKKKEKKENVHTF